MSHTFELVCHETKQRIWIGQGWGTMSTFYCGETETMNRLHRFLNATKGKELVLLCTDTEDGDWHDYPRFEEPDDDD